MRLLNSKSSARWTEHVALRLLFLLPISLAVGRTVPATADEQLGPRESTAILDEQEEGPQHQRAREEWMESLHRAAPGTDWRGIDKKTREEKNRKKLEKRRQMILDGRLRGRSARDILGDTRDLRAGEKAQTDGSAAYNILTAPLLASQPILEPVGATNLAGTWTERGSNNQAGRVLQTDVDFDNGVIYALSAGGIVWLGDLSGNNWQSLNDFFQFDGAKNIAALPTGTGGSARVLVQGPQHVYYSDDNGLSWHEPQGLKNPNDWGEITKLVIAGRPNAPIVYVMTTEWNWDSWAEEYRVYKSTDGGVSFAKVDAATMPMASVKPHIWSPRYGSDANLYILSGLQLKILTPTQSLISRRPAPRFSTAPT